MAAMMPMIATTISSSIKVKPSFFWIFFKTLLFLEGAGLLRRTNRGNVPPGDGTSV